MNTPEWTPKNRLEAFINNGLSWYLVDYNDDTTEIVHSTSLSSILQCGESMEDHGIQRMQQCWNGEDLGE